MDAGLFEFVEAMNAGNPQRSLPRRRSALRSGFATGIATLIVSGSAAVAGAYLAHKFGRNARTDGFLAAYGVYLVIVLAAQAFRIVIVPDLTRASAEGNLAAEFRSWAAAFLVLAVPISLFAAVLSHPLGELLTGRLPESASSIAARTLVWVVPAGFAQLLAALTASALAARDSYVVAAAGYALGAIANLAVFVSLAPSHGLIALAWGVALNGAIALALPLAALVRGGHVRGVLGRGVAIVPRLWKLVQAASVQLALQGLTLIGAAAGVFALVGGRVVHLFLGGAFSGEVGRDLGHLVVYLAPWMVASVAFSVTFPLLFVLERPRVLVPLAVVALLADAPLSLALRAVLDLPGLVLALAITTFGVILVLMAAVSRRMLVLAAVGLLRTAAIVATLTLVVFGLPSLVLPSIPAALAGFVLYAGALVVLRPPGLTAAWTYVRALHH